uniref:Epstein-Barr virus EBNA-1-like protein n=1 Tax=Oryza sativa subsp. japonica TaxID=39947 RepID=Q6ERG4_ORYSJ|nr:Epstein-Barr virus EBNA-1-like protein [Oryza sativa Japonica Group]BAD28756.1 Epstein-Barr virus EBNA-1-like protein [Oryza sativa Japonica Group]
MGRTRGSEPPDRIRWRKAHTGGEKRGKLHRSNGGSIKRGGSISLVQGIQFRRRMGQRSTKEGRRRAVASGSGRQWPRGHARRRRGSGRCPRAFGSATELSRRLEGARESEEGEREEALPSRDGRCDERPTAREQPLRPRAGEGEDDGARSPLLASFTRTGLPGASATDGGDVGLGEPTLGRSRRGAVGRAWSRWWQAVTLMVVGQNEKGGGERELCSLLFREKLKEGEGRNTEEPRNGFKVDSDILESGQVFGEDSKEAIEFRRLESELEF